MIVCPQCGEANPERFRLCGMCGAPLGVQLDAREVRKTVTVVFSDLKGSTNLGEQLDTESLREALTVYFDAMKAVLQRHGGTVEKYIGDAIMAVFGLPVVHEDDALRAVRAAHEMQQRLVEVNHELERRWGIRLENRTGVNTGEVVAGDASSGQRLVTGDTVNTAARLEQAAPVSEVLIGPLTHQLVRHAVEAVPVEPLELKGKAEPVPAYRLVTVSAARGSTRRLEAPMVGRRDELQSLLDAQAEVPRSESVRVVTIIGSAGVGKSRLIEEFLASLDGATVILRGRCLPYGEGITFWPVAEAVRSAAAIEEDLPLEMALQRLTTLCGQRADLAERLAPILGLSDAAYPLEETFWAVRILLETLATTAPVVIVLDDIHWAEATLLDLVEHVSDTSTAPILIVCSARGELLDERPAWAERAGAVRVDLQPLSGHETETVIANILGEVGLPSELLGRITGAAEGNPLFVEQMLSMLVDGGALRRSEAGWTVTGDVADFPVPPTIAALIAARLDRLGQEDRAVLQEGSVIGLVFHQGAVESMSPEGLRPRVDGAIRRLVRRQFARPEPTAFLDEASFRFDHALIQDAAYRSLLKRERADLHERFAAWLEAAAGDRVGETEEIVAYHLEQSARHLAELGPLDERGQALARSASTHLGSAGRRAFSRGDTPAAANLLARSVALLPPGSRARVEIQLDLAEAHADLGEFAQSESCAGEALAAARALDDGLLVTNAALVQLFLRYTLDPADRAEQVVRETQAAIPVLEAADDHVGLVRAWRLLGWVHGTACHYGAAEQAVSEAVRHARLAGDRRAETRNMMSFALSALYGPMPVPEAISIARRTASEVDDDRRAEGVVRCALAHLHGLRGEFAEARALYGEARAILEDLGGKVMAATVSLDSGRVELLADEPASAERELRRDYEVLAEIGERYTLSTLAGLLAEAVLRQGRVEEAVALTVSSQEAAAEDDVESQNLWRRIRARALTIQGRLADAQVLADDAFRLIEDTDAPLLKAASLTDMAAVHAAAGRSERAISLGRDALALVERKQDTVDAAAIRGMLASLGAAG